MDTARIEIKKAGVNARKSKIAPGSPAVIKKIKLF